MRILAVTDAERWFSFHIIGSLVDLGHNVQPFVYGAGSGEYYRWTRRHERVTKNQALVDLARQMKRDGGLDLIFCYVYDDFLTIDHARALADLGVPMVNYNVDMVNQWYRQIRTAPYFTYLLCAQRANMENLASHGASVLYFPMAARPRAEVGHNSRFIPKAPVTFLGAPTQYRIRVLAELEQSGIPIAVYGKLWKENGFIEPERNLAKTLSDIYYYAWPRVKGEGVGRLIDVLSQRLRSHLGVFGSSNGLSDISEAAKHGPLSDDDLVALFQRSSINLGFTRMIGSKPDIPGINQVKLRDFEVPLAGGFYLVEEAADHAELYSLGEEIETWRTPGELAEKIRYYLDHDAKRTAIAQAGKRRTLSDHTWQSRFQMLFDKIGLRWSGPIQ